MMDTNFAALLKLLHSTAEDDAKEGEYHPHEHICYIAADRLQLLALLALKFWGIIVGLDTQPRPNQEFAKDEDLLANLIDAPPWDDGTPGRDLYTRYDKVLAEIEEADE